MDEPAPFIQANQDGKLEISQQAKDILSSLKNPVTVVAVAGLYRTGKSFLLNRLAGKQSGFPLGSTVQAKTKGVWFWVIHHPSDPLNRHLLLLDTEGLADPEQGSATYDAWIFSMAVLLSSCLVYNSIGTIDERAIENLHLVTELTERIRIKSGEQEETGDDFDTFFPSFFWVLRDFMLELVLNGRACTADEYLENSLKLRSGVNRKVQMYNLPRQTLKAFFRERKCFTLVRPVDDPELLRNMETLAVSDLKPQFLKATNEFCQAIFDTVPNKTIAGKELNGSMLLSITETYSEAINNGAVPCIGTAFKAMSDTENRRAIDEALALYKLKMEESLKDRGPVSLEELSKSHHTAEKESVSIFLSIVVSDGNRKCQENLQELLINEREVWVKLNEEKSTERCKQIIDKLFTPIREKLQSGEYAGKGGYVKYQEDREKLHQEYNQTPDKGVSAANVLSAFNKEHEDEAHAILAADTALTEKEKELQDIARQAKEKELAARAAEEKAEEVKQKMIDEQRSHIVHIEELEKKQAKDLELAREEFERKTEKATKEQEELLRAGFKEQASLMNEQLEIVKRNKEESERMAKEQMQAARDAIRKQEQMIEELKRNPPKKKKGVFQKLGSLVGKAVDVGTSLFQIFQPSQLQPDDKSALEKRPATSAEDNDQEMFEVLDVPCDDVPRAEKKETGQDSSQGASGSDTPMSTDQMFDMLTKKFQPPKRF